MADTEYLQSKYRKVEYLPAFHIHDTVEIFPETKPYALYHANLGVGENNEAALYLVNQVFHGLNEKLIIAGNNPSEELQEAIEKAENVELKADISTEALQELIKRAQVNVLPTFQSTGIKLKLLNALFSGHHCLVNSPMVSETGLESLCTVKDDIPSLKEAVSQLMQKQFTSADIRDRKDLLEKRFSNQENALKLKEWLDE